MERPRCLPLAALAAAAAVVLQGCDSGGGDPAGTTTTTTTSTSYSVPGQCSDNERRGMCASGFCANSSCQCMPNYAPLAAEAEIAKGGAPCKKATGMQPMTFYMYRANDEEDHEWDNDDLASMSGVAWYLHNEVVVQSCPRKFNITRVVRIKVTVRNTDRLFKERQSLFGPFAIYDSGYCHDCEEEIFSKYGYVVGCQKPSDSASYSFAGYNPIWYSLPGECPGMKFSEKTLFCKIMKHGGKCTDPTGGDDCTFNYEDAGSVHIEELYGRGFDYKSFCATPGGREYDQTTDAGTRGVDFWDGKGDAVHNARRVEKLRSLFKAKYPDMNDLPEPWCDWADPAGPTGATAVAAAAPAAELPAAAPNARVVV